MLRRVALQKTPDGVKSIIPLRYADKLANPDSAHSRSHEARADD
jgi:hypothetical protein